jgi:tRNA pseudouridine55 synthase
MARKRRGNLINGWVILDKPYSLGSTPSVGRIRRLFSAQKAGHAGTLDPLATGVLPIALGEATKTVSFLMDAKKTYEFTLTFGENTDTLDKEGKVTAVSEVRPTKEAVKAQLKNFIGIINQVPPRYSAIKINGKRSYELARSGDSVEIKSRQISVENFKLIGHDENSATFMVICGKGTYIRSLARDLALGLNTCGHVTMLRRTSVGPFNLNHSFSLDELENLCHRGQVLKALRPVETALDDIPVLAITELEATELKHGRAIVNKLTGNAKYPDRILAMLNNNAVAICSTTEGYHKPKRVFNLD